MAVLNFETDEVLFYNSPSSNVINTDSSLVQVFNERQDFRLPQDVSVNDPNNWDQSSRVISRGTVVDSHYVWFNPRFVDAATFFRAIATIRFENPIIGIIGGNRELLDSNALLGLPNIIYPDNRFGTRQMDNRNPDGSRDSAVANGNVLRFDATARDGLDPVRILTAAFQNPITTPTTPNTPTTPSELPVEGSFAIAPPLFQAGALNRRNRKIGTRDNDVLTGDNRQNFILGKAGNDRLNGKGGNDTIRGDRGNDRLFGGSNNDRLIGGSGDDRLIGGTGFDVMTGNAGDDILIGQAGDDILIGGAGNDTLTGGLGQDLFVFRSLSDAVDTIQDFTVGVDLIDLRGIFTAIPAVTQFEQFIDLTQVGANAELRVSTNGANSEFTLLATLINSVASDINADSFIVA